MQRRPHRPIERAVQRLMDRGLPVPEIAWRLRRSPAHVRRIHTLAELPRTTPAERRSADVLRPIERVVLRARAQGSGREEIAARLRRTPAHVERIEAYANYKQRHLPPS